MCVIDLYLVPLVLSYYGAFLVILGYCVNHRHLGWVITYVVLCVAATIAYLIRRRLYKKENR